MQEIILNKQLPVISMNFAEVKASLIEGAEKYKNIIVTEDGLKDCKATQKDLASTRIKLDNYRKEIKKEMSKPIEMFESQCKELIALVAEVENPIKEGITVFDQKKKDANRKIAEDIITEAIKEHGLNEKYSSGLNVLDKYTNLTSKPSDVKNDVEQRLFILLQEQQQEEECLQIMKDTIENVNKNIDAKLSLEDFQSLLDMKASPVKIMQEINARAERIKFNELKAVAEKEARAEKEVLERIAKAEREAVIKAENLARIERELKEEKEREVKALNQNIVIEVDPIKEVIIPVIEREIQLNEKMYFIEMRVEGTLQEIKNLSQFLRDNKYNYNATDKGEM